jgi:hypothetical protein
LCDINSPQIFLPTSWSISRLSPDFSLDTFRNGCSGDRTERTRLASFQLPLVAPTDPRAAEQPRNGECRAAERPQLVRLGCCPGRKRRSNEIVGLELTDYIFVGQIGGNAVLTLTQSPHARTDLTIYLRLQESSLSSPKISRSPLSPVSSQLRLETRQRVCLLDSEMLRAILCFVATEYSRWGRRFAKTVSESPGSEKSKVRTIFSQCQRCCSS